MHQTCPDGDPSLRPDRTSLHHSRVDRLVYSMEGAATALSRTRKAIYDLIQEGKLESFKDGRRRYILASELRRYVETVAGTPNGGGTDG